MRCNFKKMKGKEREREEKVNTKQIFELVTYIIRTVHIIITSENDRLTLYSTWQVLFNSHFIAVVSAVH